MSDDWFWKKWKNVPNPFKGRPINKLFKMKDGKYGSIDAKIERWRWCQKCNHHCGKEAKKCTSCSRKLTNRYVTATCAYTERTCTVNRWGCSIHFKIKTQHPFTCCCDQCY